MLEYWFMFPVGILFSAIAMMIGIGGAAMFTPFFFLVLGLPAKIAVGVGLVIEMFGFSSGLWGFARRKLICYKLGGYLLIFTIPSALVGVFLNKIIDDAIVKMVFATLLLILSLLILKPDRKVTVKVPKKHGKTDRDKYDRPRRDGATSTLSIIGGALAGLASTGIGEVNDYLFLKRYRMPGALAAGTSVFVVAMTILVGGVAHLFTFDPSVLPNVLGIMLFAIPGVVLGAQAGVRFSEILPDKRRKQIIAVLFIALAVVTIVSLTS